ncbi:MAG: tRNA (adenosine(37)-N6)-dimethylallyltransferase MiaA [Pseudomonadota bacterium]
MSLARPPLICLMGPTAAGKTDLAIELAEARGCELVSVDSALVYRGLDIGSAKPSYPHHLIDVRDPLEIYSAADFAMDANRLAAEITARGRTPLFVGGSMLYFKAFLEGLAEVPAAVPEIRREIEAEAATQGWPQLHAQLAEVDPVAAARIHPNHSRRIGRALEVYRSSGTTLTQWQAQTSDLPLPSEHYRVIQMAICPSDRAALHQRIHLRLKQMIAEGLLDEVRILFECEKLHRDLPAIRAVGYYQLWRHLEGEYSLAEAVERAEAATRQMAKRQLTWLRKWPDLAWILTDDQGNLTAATESEDSAGLIGEKPIQWALSYLDNVPV